MKKMILFVGAAVTACLSAFAAPTSAAKSELEVPYLSLYYVQPQVAESSKKKIILSTKDTKFAGELVDKKIAWWEMEEQGK